MCLTGKWRLTVEQLRLRLHNAHRSDHHRLEDVHGKCLMGHHHRWHHRETHSFMFLFDCLADARTGILLGRDKGPHPRGDRRHI